MLRKERYYREKCEWKIKKKNSENDNERSVQKKRR